MLSSRLPRLNAIRPFGPGAFAWAGDAGRAMPAHTTMAVSHLVRRLNGGSFQLTRVGRDPGLSVLARTLTPLRWTLVLAREQLGSVGGSKHPRWLQAVIVAGHSSHPAERCTAPGPAMLTAAQGASDPNIDAGHSVCPGDLCDDQAHASNRAHRRRPCRLPSLRSGVAPGRG